MSTVVISKEQAKFARYLANKAFEKKGTSKKADGKKERTYIAPGCCLIWTEAPVAEGVETEVIKAVWQDKEYSEGMLVYDSRHMDFMAAASILGCDGGKPENKPHQDIVDAVMAATEYITQEAEPVAEEPVAAIEATPGEPEVTRPKPAMPLHAKYTACAAMRLAHDLGYPLDTPLKEIVEKEGTPAVLRYQEILRAVPAYGLTEARLKFAFPVEYVLLP